jgi:hypothetical protein
MARSLEHLQNAWTFGPNHLRFATFTIPNVRNIAEGIEWIAEAWHRALATKTWGRLVAGGFRTWEVKPGKDGKWNVHLHAILVLWSGRVPYETLRGIWDQAARLKCNIRFDELRGIKARNGRSKAASVAAYITKYLVKVEDLAACGNAPGGLPHLTAALENRRLFGAFGCAAIARRWIRTQRPRWMEQTTRAMLGYRDPDGFPPIAAFIESSDGQQVEAPIPRPQPPACLNLEALDTHPGFTPEDTAQEWNNPGPKTAGLFPWRKVPKTQAEADARAATARTLRGLALAEPDAARAALLRALARSIAPPQAFRWGRWWNATSPSTTQDTPQDGHQRRRETWALRSLETAIVPTVETPHYEPLHEWMLAEVDKASQQGCKSAALALHGHYSRLGWSGAVEFIRRQPAHIRASLEERDPWQTQEPPHLSLKPEFR